MVLRPSTSLILAAAIALGAGLITMGVTNYVVYLGGFTGFWGLFFGSFVAVIAFGVGLALASTSSQRSFVGRVVAAIACFLLAALVAWWIAAWGVPVMSLEGAWLWPLGIVCGVSGVLLLRRRSWSKTRFSRPR
jgi:hypothetical protein